MGKNIFNRSTYTAESVTCGHPDKVCDQISDAILDACLAQDPNSRVAVETFGTHGHLIIGGEVSTQAKVRYEEIARKVIFDIGYRNLPAVQIFINEQSPDIAQGVDTGGAGDQGIMYGYATNETLEYLPKGLVLAHKLAKGLEDLRRQNILSWLCPDGKTQVTITDSSISTILVSTQHKADITQEQIQGEIKECLIKPLINTEGVEILINPTRSFILGGFEADTGLTGRKIMVDTYGGLAPHGGGCFSGKDSSKVDRSGAYMARLAAKSIVAGGLAKECLVSVAYAIGCAEPVMVRAEDENGKDLSSIVKNNFDFRPQAIIECLNLRRPIFLQTAAYGHFGKLDLPWEEVVQIS